MTARQHLPKHPRQGQFFRWLQRVGITSESMADYVRDCTGVSYAPATIRAWATGRLPIDAEAVFLALDHAGDEAGAILDALCREYGHRAVPLFHYLADLAGVRVRIERGGACGDVAKEGTEAVAAAGRVTHELLARLADGQIDDADAEAMLPLADDLVEQATEFRAALRQRVAGSRR